MSARCEPRAHHHGLRSSSLTGLPCDGNRAKPTTPALARRHRDQRRERPFVVALVFILVLGLVAFMSPAGKGRAHQETATTALARGGRNQRRQRAFVFVIIFVFVLDAVVTGPAGESGAQQEAAPLATAYRRQEEEPAKMVFVVIIFILVLDVVAFMSSAGERQTHQETAPLAAADCGREKKAAKVPLIIVIVLVLFLDAVVFAASAGECRQPDHTTASTTLAQSSCQGELSTATHLFETINVLVRILGHVLPFLHFGMLGTRRKRPVAPNTDRLALDRVFPRRTS
jgi:hypothetical protein